jgi:hypothetical protein
MMKFHEEHSLGLSQGSFQRLHFILRGSYLKFTKVVQSHRKKKRLTEKRIWNLPESEEEH